MWCFICCDNIIVKITNTIIEEEKLKGEKS